MISQNTQQIVSDIDKLLSAIKKAIPLWVLGTEEITHQSGLINIFEHHSKTNPQLTGISKKLSLLMWMQNPLDRTATQKCHELNGSSCSAPLSKLLNAILSLPQPEIPFEDLDNLLQSRDRKLIIRHLFPLLRGPDGFTWLTHCWDTLLRMGNPDIPVTALDLINWNKELIPIKQRLKAQYYFLYRPADESLSAVEKLDGNIWSLWKEYMRCELLLRTNRQKEAVECLSALWKSNVWNINWGQKLHALLNPIDTTGALNDSADVCILMYSWNNGKLIENTLKNVAESSIGNAKVFALNNGSSDNTGEVVSAAKKLFQREQYKEIQLPVNVGAPPARNWLLAEPEVRRSKWAVFLDDDVELPENWLKELLATAKHYNNPGAVGCRITSASVPTSLQSADYHLFPPGNGTSQIDGLTEHVMVFDSCRNAFDCGQFSYTRPAVHVSGCCHMLNMEAVHKCGPFDVRFNPTQFDDLERDLRASLGGYTHIYAGQLGIQHIQHSSLAKASNMRGMAQVFGNKIKLESKYSADNLNSIFSKDLTRLWADTEKKWKELAETV
ncbi:glycosyltransferase family 2 protein [Maridesulfovibrio hydrothermalis]|uniref:Glycosyl transferase family 2 n=1 Tax=Maridesulfovibrio hydrothermalis AM13 = DSM 14728 TaxID=1121451 RepID=L0RCJ0_9BACT|nr:glycosyltransferase [Maridesulfovibrio hydrothermalis]CCO23922.1 Glycosyl transferase family 2 [Maridesulfovibrio hydrothermalis AM13 = DSM 14728]